MAVPIAHFAVGVAVSFGGCAAVVALHPRRLSRRFMYWPAFVTACGLWALIPKCLGALGAAIGWRWVAKVFRLYLIGDVFFFHAILSRVEAQGSTWGLMLTIAVYTAMILWYIAVVRRVDRQEGLRWRGTDGGVAARRIG